MVIWISKLPVSVSMTIRAGRCLEEDWETSCRSMSGVQTPKEPFTCIEKLDQAKQYPGGVVPSCALLSSRLIPQNTFLLGGGDASLCHHQDDRVKPEKGMAISVKGLKLLTWE